jgi:segregation and condensation protein A
VRRPWHSPSRCTDASGSVASLPPVQPTPVRELELELDAFEGPFDLLLTLLLKEELEPREIDIAAIVLAFVERLAERDELDLEACGEFLVLVSALLELKARSLFPDEAAELDELEPEEAAEELARRLAEYRRMKEAAAWLLERLGSEQDRWFRIGPAPLAPRAERRLASQDPEALSAALRALAVPPPNVSLGHMALRFPPVSQFLERFRALLGRRRVFDFDTEVEGLSRVEQAVALLALLELRKSGEITLSQAQPFAPIRVSSAPRSAAPSGRSPAPPWPREAEEGIDTADDERIREWTLRSA